jgi:hypothetical protein
LLSAVRIPELQHDRRFAGENPQSSESRQTTTSHPEWPNQNKEEKWLKKKKNYFTF